MINKNGNGGVGKKGKVLWNRGADIKTLVEGLV